ncbi:MAG TPA: DegV family protein [Clostridia bacterium]|nr:DegV family protein [Clostridia bacterium]
MPKPVAITADSPIDLSPELAKQFNIAIIPLYISLGGKTYRDGVDISPEDIFKRYEEDKIIPHTSSIPIPDYNDFFRHFTDQGMAVVHFSLSSAISSTHQNARIAASELDDVYVVDSRSLSTGIAMLALEACELRDKGLAAADIFDKANLRQNLVHQSFVVDKLEFLRKGGRCSALTALGANMLNIHPSIDMREGALELVGRHRGKIQTVQLRYVEGRLAKVEDINLNRVIICHSGIPSAQLEAVREVIQNSQSFKEVLITRAGCTISTHCGPNCLGLSFMQN